MIEILKLLWSGLWPEIRALAIRLGLKLAQRTGSLLVTAVKEGMASADRKLPDGSWIEKLGHATDVAVTYLEAEGLKMGKDFYRNDLVGMVTAQVEKKWEEVSATTQ